MSPSTNRIIPETFSSDDLTEMPDFADLTPEMIEYHVRRGRQMRAEMFGHLVSGGWRHLRNWVSGLSDRLFGTDGHLGTSR